MNVVSSAWISTSTGQGLPLDHLHLAIIHEHTDHRVVDVELIHVVHAAR